MSQRASSRRDPAARTARRAPRRRRSGRPGAASTGVATPPRRATRRPRPAPTGLSAERRGAVADRGHGLADRRHDVDAGIGRAGRAVRIERRARRGPSGRGPTARLSRCATRTRRGTSPGRRQRHARAESGPAGSRSRRRLGARPRPAVRSRRGRRCRHGLPRLDERDRDDRPIDGEPRRRGVRDVRPTAAARTGSARRPVVRARLRRSSAVPVGRRLVPPEAAGRPVYSSPRYALRTISFLMSSSAGPVRRPRRSGGRSRGSRSRAPGAFCSTSRIVVPCLLISRIVSEDLLDEDGARGRATARRAGARAARTSAPGRSPASAARRRTACRPAGRSAP